MFLNNVCWMLHKSLVLVTSTKLINDRSILHSALVISFFGLWVHLYCYYAFSLDPFPPPHTIPGLTIQVIFYIAASSKLQFFFLVAQSSPLIVTCLQVTQYSIPSRLQIPGLSKILGCKRGYRRRILLLLLLLLPHRPSANFSLINPY